MDVGRNRLSRAACGVAMALALAFSAAAWGAQSPSKEAAPSSTATSESVADAEAMQAAETTLRAFFAVKGRAEDPISVLIDEQAVYLTGRDVHPTAAYEEGMKDRPSLITDSMVSVELSSSRWIGDEIKVDFEFDRSGVSYPMIGDEMQLDAGLPAEGHWDGTATLVIRDGEWLIDDLTVDASGGRVG